MPKTYVAVFILPRPQREHAEIATVIRAASNGDMAQYVISGGVMFFYTSETPPWELSFSQILHNGDSVFITETSERAVHSGFSSAAGWLNRHHPRR